jgi:hypothetical protein
MILESFVVLLCVLGAVSMGIGAAEMSLGGDDRDAVREGNMMMITGALLVVGSLAIFTSFHGVWEQLLWY